MNKKTIVIYAALIASMGLAGCANNPYASNGTTADATGGALLGGIAGAVIGNQTGSPLAGAAIGAGVGGIAGYGIGNAANNAYTRTGHHYQMEMTSFTCPAGYICRPTQNPSHPSPTLAPPAIKKPVNQPVKQYVPHFPFCAHGKVCEYHQQSYVTQHGKTVFVVNTPPPPGSRT